MIKKTLRSKFEEAFREEFPCTFEAANRGEPKPHGDMSCAWWGFKEGYRSALPTTEPKRDEVVCHHCHFLTGIAFGAVGFMLLMKAYSYIGYFS